MLRNLLYTLYRYFTSTLLNILGLSLAFAAFLVIFLQVWSEYRFDKWHSKSDRIYHLSLDDFNAIPKDLIAVFGESSPQIENYTALEKAFGEVSFHVERDGVKEGFSEPIDKVFSNLSEVFDFQMVEGVFNSIDAPLTVLLPKSIAVKLFGDNSALGRQLIINDSLSYQVGGVFKDLPQNTQLNNRIYIGLNREIKKPSWGRWNYHFYAVLKEGANTKDIIDNFNENYDFRERMYSDNQNFKFNKMSDIYFTAPLEFSDDKHGDVTTTYTLLIIGLLLLLISAINYVNFSTALAPVRMKSINIQKIFGSSTLKLRLVLVFEAVALCVVSYLFSLLLISIFNGTALKRMLLGDLSFTDDYSLYLIPFGIALLIGFLSGLYPAFYLTKQSPVMAIKGDFAFSSSGKRLRKILMGLQFIISSVLIVLAMFMQAQNEYMKYKDTGLDKEHIAVVQMGGDILKKAAVKIFEKELLESHLISKVAFCESNIFGTNNVQRWAMEIKENKNAMMNVYMVSSSFPELIGVNIEDGAYFREENYTEDRDKQYAIVNRTAANKFDIKMGDTEKQLSFNLVGICKDFNFKSLHHEIEPMSFILMSDQYGTWLKYCYIKITGNPYEAADYIKKAAAEIDPVYPISIQFADQNFNARYNKEIQMTSLIVTASLFVIMISLMGVIGMVIFETQYRRKEIGLRKINGATIFDILFLFNKKFIWMILVCFIIALPVAWYSVNMWLQNFEYRVSLYWWIFVVALLLVLIIVLTTVTIQSWSSAKENPIKSLKGE